MTFQQVLELQPDSISSWYQLALLQLRQGDLPTYRATCEEIMRRFADRNDSITQDWLTWTALLGSESLADLSVPLEIATNLVSSFPTDPQPATTLGGLLYRTGKYAEAATALRNSATIASRISLAHRWPSISSHTRAATSFSV